jgi:hypothetical protein
MLFLYKLLPHSHMSVCRENYAKGISIYFIFPCFYVNNFLTILIRKHMLIPVLIPPDSRICPCVGRTMLKESAYIAFFPPLIILIIITRLSHMSLCSENLMLGDLKESWFILFSN